MLLVATFRDVEADMPVAVSDALVDVYRSEGVVRVHLGGLSEDEIAEFVRLTTGVEAAGDLRAAIAELTGGNAFLVNKLWRGLVESGAIEVGPMSARLARPTDGLQAPTTVREVVSQRIARSGGMSRRPLRLALIGTLLASST